MQKRATRKRGYVTTLAIVGLGLVVTYAAVLARYALSEVARERRATLQTHAYQVAQSARAWSSTHAEKLRATSTVTLPIDELLPDECGGVAELQSVPGTDQRVIVQLQLTLHQGRRSLRRQIRWELPPITTTRPASGPATP